MKSLDLEHIRLIAVGLVSPLLAYITPTKGFVIALVIAFGANVICGMLTVVYSANKIGSVTGLGSACPANSIVINTSNKEYYINVE